MTMTTMTWLESADTCNLYVTNKQTHDVHIIYTHTHTQIHDVHIIYTHTHTNTWCTHHLYTHTYTNTWCTHHLYTCVHKYMYTHTHTHTHAHTCTHIHTPCTMNTPVAKEAQKYANALDVHPQIFSKSKDSEQNVNETDQDLRQITL